MTYGVNYGRLHIDITILEDGASMPKVYTARFVPAQEPVPFYGYGRDEQDAIVDLLRATRDSGRSLPGPRQVRN